MLTGTIRTQIDQTWNTFWSGGVSNPLSVIEQLTFRLFIKRLDELHTREESKTEMLDTAMDRRIPPRRYCRRWLRDRPAHHLNHTFRIS